ncbi:regulatory protein, IclR [alpha proteobacterium BAL199]|jgi:DNA-binding IclR family transcriptional regulator|nr:regulatory protein, IclR [alpha proteobacterium BAL199]
MPRRPTNPRLTNIEDWRAGADADPGFVTALARGLEILRAFGRDDRYLGNGELAKRTGIPKSTVSRLTQTLTSLGYLRYVDQLERYQLGPGVLALGYRYLAGNGVRDLAHPHMQALADSTDCSVALGTGDRSEMVYTDVCQGKGPLILRLDVGARIPMPVTSMGRAYIAGLPEADRDSLLARLKVHYGDAWPALRDGIDQSLRFYADHGYCVSEGDWNRDVASAGVPLVLEGGAHVLAFNCGGSSLRLTRRVLERSIGPRLQELVRLVERDLTGGGAPTLDYGA